MLLVMYGVLLCPATPAIGILRVTVGSHEDCDSTARIRVGTRSSLSTRGAGECQGLTVVCTFSFHLEFLGGLTDEDKSA